jgi:hypothetical protein
MDEGGLVMAAIPQLGKLLIVIGIVVTVLGIILLFSGKTPWLGRLPGDFYFKDRNFSFYFPLATSLRISIVLSLILWLIDKK